MRFCEVPNCNVEIHAGGLCFKHYMRVRRHGVVDGGRNGDGRVKSTHPLWECWKSLLRAARRRSGYDPRWDDFWAFVEDIVEKPEPRARLYRKDDGLPYGPQNCEWRSPALEVSQLKDKAAYQRAWRMTRPNLARNANLKKCFGISLDRYEEMLAVQGGVCDVCSQKEAMRHTTTGEVKALSVDHDHQTGAIRGLLCHHCNRGLGSFRDSIPLLRAAITYLEKHQNTASAHFTLVKVLPNC